jgi:FkbM family methyltransferase
MIRTRVDCQNLVRRVAKAILGKDHLIKNDVRIDLERLGTRYGGWVVSKNLLCYTAQPLVMSFGIGDDISFDLEMIRRYGARVFAFDPTPKAIEWIGKQRVPHAMRVFKIGLADVDGEQDFGFPDNPAWDDFSTCRRAQKTVRCKVARLSTIMHECAVDSIDVMKMDIEGSEYPVIHGLCRSDMRPKQLLVEFHHGLHGISVEETRKAVASLREAGYLVFDVSPWGREFSFLHTSGLYRAKG